MKKLFCLSLIIATLFSSCTTSADLALKRAEGKSVDEKIEIYEEEVKDKKANDKIYYNLAILYSYKGEYDKAESIAESFPSSYRFLNLLLYIAEVEENEGKEMDILNKILLLTPSDIKMLERKLSLLTNKDEIIELSKEILNYDSSNKKALNALSVYYPEFKIYLDKMNKEEYGKKYNPFLYSSLALLTRAEEKTVPYI